MSFDRWVQQYMIKESLCESMQEITELRSNGQNPQTNWKEVTEHIKENAIKITEERKNNDKRSQRDMETQNKRISSQNVTIENRKRAREDIMFLKSSLKK